MVNNSNKYLKVVFSFNSEGSETKEDMLTDQGGWVWVSTWVGKWNYVEDSDYEHQVWVLTSQELRPCRQYLEGDGNLSLRKDRVFSGVWGQRRESPAEWVSSSKQCPDREVCVHHYMRDCLLWQLRGVRCISLDQNIISRRPRWSVRPLRDGQSVTVSLCTVLTSLQEKVQSVGAESQWSEVEMSGVLPLVPRPLSPCSLLETTCPSCRRPSVSPRLLGCLHTVCTPCLNKVRSSLPSLLCWRSSCRK